MRLLRIIRFPNEDNETRVKDQVAFMVQYRYTCWIQGYPCKNKSGHETLMKSFHDKALLARLGARKKPASHRVQDPVA